MNAPGIPWIDLMFRQTQRCQHLAWFLYGCVEREHRLNLDACVTRWVQALTPAATLRSAASDHAGIAGSRRGLQQPNRRRP